ncbi:MAG: translocation/assembly module TamB domain-containing protein [Vicinamibacterales bacterium]
MAGGGGRHRRGRGVGGHHRHGPPRQAARRAGRLHLHRPARPHRPARAERRPRAAGGGGPPRRGPDARRAPLAGRRPHRALPHVERAHGPGSAPRHGRDARLDADGRELRQRDSQLAAPERSSPAAPPEDRHDHAAVHPRHPRASRGARLRVVVGAGCPEPRGGRGQGRRIPRPDDLRRRHAAHPAVRAHVGDVRHRLRRPRRQGPADRHDLRRRRRPDAGRGDGRSGQLPGDDGADHVAAPAAADARHLLREGHVRPARRGRLHRHGPQVHGRLRGEGRLREPRGGLRRLPVPELPGVGRVGADAVRRHAGHGGAVRRHGVLHLRAVAAGRSGAPRGRCLGRAVPRRGPHDVHRLPPDARPATRRARDRAARHPLDARRDGRRDGRRGVRHRDARGGRGRHARAARGRGRGRPAPRRRPGPLQPAPAARARARRRRGRLHLHGRDHRVRAEPLRHRRDLHVVRRPDQLGQGVAAAFRGDQHQLAGEPPPARGRDDDGGRADRLGAGRRLRALRGRHPRRPRQPPGRGRVRRQRDPGVERDLGPRGRHRRHRELVRPRARRRGDCGRRADGHRRHVCPRLPAQGRRGRDRRPDPHGGVAAHRLSRGVPALRLSDLRRRERRDPPERQVRGAVRVRAPVAGPGRGLRRAVRHGHGQPALRGAGCAPGRPRDQEGRGHDHGRGLRGLGRHLLVQRRRAAPRGGRPGPHVLSRPARDHGLRGLQRRRQRHFRRAALRRQGQRVRPVHRRRGHRRDDGAGEPAGPHAALQLRRGLAAPRRVGLGPVRAHRRRRDRDDHAGVRHVTGPLRPRVHAHAVALHDGHGGWTRPGLGRGVHAGGPPRVGHHRRPPPPALRLRTAQPRRSVAGARRLDRQRRRLRHGGRSDVARRGRTHRSGPRRGDAARQRRGQPGRPAGRAAGRSRLRPRRDRGPDRRLHRHAHRDRHRPGHRRAHPVVRLPARARGHQRQRGVRRLRRPPRRPAGTAGRRHHPGRRPPRLRGLALSDYDVTLEGHDLRLRYPEGLRSLVDAALTVQGSADAPVLGGSVLVRNAVWTPSFDGSTSVFGSSAGDAAIGGAPGLEGTAAAAPASPLRLDIRLVAPSTFRIENDVARIVASADVNVRGTADRPQVFGHADIERGEVRFEGRRYVVSRGSLDFTNPDRIQPFFDVEADTRVRVPGQTYRVTLRIAGTTERLQPEFTSDPPLPSADVLSLLLSDRTPTGDVEVTSINRPNQREIDLLAARATRGLTGALSAEVGKVVQETFGVDTFQITPLLVDPYQQVGGLTVNPAARVTIGKRLSDRIYLTYVRSLSSSERDQIILLEYDQSDTLGWVLSQNEDGTYAIEVRKRVAF